MKKQYIKPEVKVEEILPVAMLAASNPSMGWDDSDEGVDAASNNRRGTWGNLWD